MSSTYGINLTPAMAKEIENRREANVKQRETLSTSRIPYFFKEDWKKVMERPDAQPFLAEVIKGDQMAQTRQIRLTVVLAILGVALAVLGAYYLSKQIMEIKFNLAKAAVIGVALVSGVMLLELGGLAAWKAYLLWQERKDNEKLLHMVKNNIKFIEPVKDNTTISQETNMRLVKRIFGKNVSLKDYYLNMKDRDYAKREIKAINAHNQNEFGRLKYLPALIALGIVFLLVAFLVLNKLPATKSQFYLKIGGVALYASGGIGFIACGLYAIAKRYLLKKDLEETLAIQKVVESRSVA